MNKRILTLLLLCCSTMLFAQSVKKVEYYFDTDPGFGKGKALSIDATGEVTAAIDISSLEDGLHILAIRASSSAGKWSVATHMPISILHNSEVQAVEYYFDEDPGFGKGTALAFTQQGNAYVVKATIDISALRAGLHTLAIRSQNSAGEWSAASHTLVSVLPNTNVQAVEYFFDEDPGFGKGTALAFTEQGNAYVVNATLDVSGLADGLHVLVIRAQNSGGIWSNATQTLLMKRTPALESDSIVSVQYYWDEALETKADLAFTKTEQGADVSVVINGLDSFEIGTPHYLFIEYRTAKGNVSQSCYEVIRIEAPLGTGTEQVTITELKIYPVPFTTQLFIDALGEGDRIVLTDLSGRQLLAATKAELHGNGLQVGHLPVGTYLLTVYQEQNVISKVVIKQ